MDEIVNIIQSVGFPIAAFLLMFWQNCTIVKENTKAIRELVSYLKSNE